METQQAPVTDPFIGAMLEERLLIVDKLGQGGVGVVYLAIDAEVGQRVALKVLALERVPERYRETSQRKFADEAAALALISHPNVVRLHRFGEFRGAPYLAMEFVPGAKTLESERLSRVMDGRCFSVSETHALLVQLLNGLQAAHEGGVLHRDIKPENLMLQQVPGHDLLLRIVDFGIAKHMGASARTTHAAGTPAYMAPEQMLNAAVGPWTDLYAVGVVAFEMLVGHLPFAGDSVHRIYASKVDPTFDPLAGDAEHVLAPALAAFLRRSLAHDTTVRFQSAAEMREELDKALVAAQSAHVSVAPATETAMPVDGNEGEDDFARAKRQWLTMELARLSADRSPSDE